MNEIPENAFVIHRHRAKRAGLHFDLRMREGDSMRSWAIPKAHLPEKGEKLLAMETDLHELESYYLEGEIPDGEYGTGTMEVFCRGTYETIERTEKAWKFRLISDQCYGVFVLVHTGENRFIFMRGKDPV